jgi:hypothetical protein
VEGEHRGFHRASDAGKGHQVAQKHDDRRLLGRLEPLRRLSGRQGLETGPQDVHPAADEARLLLAFRRRARAHAVADRSRAAAGMVRPDDMGDPQHRARVVAGGRVAVVAAVGSERRDGVGDVARGEEVALIGPEDGGDMRPAAAAGDHHRARMPAVRGEAAIPGAVLGMGRGPAAVTAPHRMVRAWPGGLRRGRPRRMTSPSAIRHLPEFRVIFPALGNGF